MFFLGKDEILERARAEAKKRTEEVIDKYYENLLQKTSETKSQYIEHC